MSGPLPDNGPTERRNAPTIPTTALPAGGRQGPTPDLPAWISLEAAGLAWWEWAWHTPQAAAWDDGALVFITRRAQLEDDLASLVELGDDFDLAALLEIDESEVTRRLTAVFARVKSMATNKIQVSKECRELDNRLGLNPKAMAELRWSIVASGGPPPQKSAPKSSSKRRLTVVEAPNAVEGTKPAG